MNDGSARSITPTTYNPSANSPIKAPEPKFCITCGQPIAPDIRPLTNEMNVYVNTASNGKVVINEVKDELTIQGVLLLREGSKSWQKWNESKNIPPTNLEVPESTPTEDKKPSEPAKTELEKAQGK